MHGGGLNHTPARRRNGAFSIFKAETEQMGRFDGLGALGGGCMGGVYRAFDRKTGREVALKVARESAGAREALRREKRALSEITSPNIANLLDSGRFGDGPFEGSDFLVLEHVRGKSLSARLGEGRVYEAGEARGILLGVCSALIAVHSAGFIHRDIKPSNVMITEGGAVLLDFGVSERVHGGSVLSRLLRVSFMPGNLSYCAPELFGGRTDERTDLYALGMLAYHMVSGRAPAAPYWMDESERILLGGLRETAPCAAASIILKAVRERAEERYQSASEMLEALRRHWPLRS